MKQGLKQHEKIIEEMINSKSLQQFKAPHTGTNKPSKIVLDQESLPSPVPPTKAIANWQYWFALIDFPFCSSIDARLSPKCSNPKETIKNGVDWLVMQQYVKAQYLLMVQSEGLLWKEGPTRTLNNEISELQARVAFPQHWSSGEHENHLERLRQLNQAKLQKSKEQQ